MTSVHDDLPGSVQTYDFLGSLNPRAMWREAA